MTTTEPVAVEVRRGHLIESVHRAKVAVTAPDGSLRLAIGDVAAPVLPRSATKPMQAIAMLRSGLDLTGPLLALAGASHSGEPFHLAAVVDILDGAGLSAADLQNTPDYPLDEQARRDWIAGGAGPASLAQNCSGKHAGMLRTCIRAGWPTSSYRSVQHPLQVAVREVVAEYAGEEIADPEVDGCGAPAYASSLAGLARSYGKIAAATDGEAKALADAYRTHPVYVSGTHRDEVVVHHEVPGLVCKGGAEAVYAAGLADGTGIAVKMCDGMGRGRTEVLVGVLTALGHGTDTLAGLHPIAVLGHGAPVGEVRLADDFVRALAPLG